MAFNNDVKINKSWYSYLKTYLVVIIFALILTALTALLFGYKYFIVNGWSAEPYIHYGSLIAVKKPSSVEIGDFVTYSTNGTFVTHRVVEVHDDGTFIICQVGGNASQDPVLSLTDDSFVVGKVQLVVPYVNNILIYIKNNVIELIAFIGSIYVILSYFAQRNTYELEEN